ncbi:MAG: PIG-L family deacetylase [Thaumarchaeota archaeon]|nr:PIG-L family deacetylase [Nitrososphaerota archaeon]
MAANQRAKSVGPESVIVVLSPHVDDATLSVGGSILLLGRMNGVTVYNLFSISDHTRSTRFSSTILATTVRFLEEQIAATLISYSPRFFVLQDSSLRSKEERSMVQRLGTILRKELARDKPDVVLVPMGVGGHPDHEVVFDAFIGLLQEGSVSKEQVRLYEDVPYANPSSVESRIAKLSHHYGLRLSPEFVDITGVFPMKMKAVGVYRSQFQSKDMKRIRDYARWIGEQGKVSSRGPSRFYERRWLIQ